MDFYSQNGQDKFLLNTLFKNKKNGFFVEVGADDGIDKSNTFMFEKIGWQGICIEPSPERFLKLAENRNCILVNKPISNVIKTVDFMDISGYGKGFVLHPFNRCIEPEYNNLLGGIKNSKLNQCKNIEFIRGCYGKSFTSNYNFKDASGQLNKITSYNLEALIDNVFFDVVHLDVQGSEVNLQYTDKKTLDNIGYIFISTHSDKIHKNIIDFLNDNNFHVIVEHSQLESSSGDGLIFAINKKNALKYSKNIEPNVYDYLKDKCKITRM